MRGLELIVGIPSYMEADQIPFVTSQVDRGIVRYAGNLQSLIVNIDNNSEDDTKGAFLSTRTKTPKHYISTRKGIRGKGNNIRNLFKFALQHAESLKAVVIVDADLRSIRPEWIKYLSGPILRGFDYAIPMYSRHQFDGTITNHICYPLLYSIVGEDIKQPIGGEFAFSPSLVKYWLQKKWDSNVGQYGIDIFMTLHAILGKFKICEVGLGTKVHKASAPKIGAMFTQVVSTFFNLLLEGKSSWVGVRNTKPKSIRRFGLKSSSPPQELKIDILDLKKQLRDEYFQRGKLLKKYLSDYILMRLQTMFDQDYYDMTILMWTQVVYQLLHAYDVGSSKVRQEIIEALKPLYFARAVTFDYKAWRYDEKYVEELIMEQAMAFAAQRPYFLGLDYLHTVKGRRRQSV